MRVSRRCKNPGPLPRHTTRKKEVRPEFTRFANLVVLFESWMGYFSGGVWSSFCTSKHLDSLKARQLTYLPNPSFFRTEPPPKFEAAIVQLPPGVCHQHPRISSSLESPPSSPKASNLTSSFPIDELPPASSYTNIQELPSDTSTNPLAFLERGDTSRELGHPILGVNIKHDWNANTDFGRQSSYWALCESSDSMPALSNIWVLWSHVTNQENSFTWPTRKIHSSQYTSLQCRGTILQYRVGMEGFSLSMQKGGTLQKNTSLQTLVVYPYQPRVWKDSEHSLHEFSVGNGKIWQTLRPDQIFPDFLSLPFQLVQITSKLPGKLTWQWKKTTPHLQDVSPAIKSGDFPTCHSLVFQGGGVTGWPSICCWSSTRSSSTRKIPSFSALCWAFSHERCTLILSLAM